MAVGGHTTTAVLSAGIGAATARGKSPCCVPEPGPTGASVSPPATHSWAFAYLAAWMVIALVILATRPRPT